MASPLARFAARVVADWRLRFLATVALATLLTLGLMGLDPTSEVDARSGASHPCLLGDAPCSIAAPTPRSR